ncbi:MAG: A/G-specific adenine glycosylase [Flammeovirgaceae bacterium]|nr:MAG: A/G-specific adenine glycosylase [Flammeovirgaceae bacterium]
MDNRYFSQKVVEWYLKNKRNLPWRNTTDPYKVWLSEIILQQTRVEQGLPYYSLFIKKFPTVKALAAAPAQLVLRAWQGLGYYTRARNLHRCAHIVAQQLNGKFPDNYAALLTLPGIGNYTAAAIASICFNEPVAVVDGNVFRVLARVFGIYEPINSVSGKQRFNELANILIDKERPALFNQAIMEFGALHCTPRNPLCADCIFKKQCVAYAGILQTELPVKIKKKPARNRYFTYVVFRKGNFLFMNKRSAGDIWQSLYDFYLVEGRSQKLTLAWFKKHHTELAPLLTQVKQPGATRWYRHNLSHQKIFARFLVVNGVPDKKLGLRKFSLKTVENLPKPVLISRFLKDAQLL